MTDVSRETNANACSLGHPNLSPYEIWDQQGSKQHPSVQIASIHVDLSPAPHTTREQAIVLPSQNSENYRCTGNNHHKQACMSIVLNTRTESKNKTIVACWTHGAAAVEIVFNPPPIRYYFLVGMRSPLQYSPHRLVHHTSHLPRP